MKLRHILLALALLPALATAQEKESLSALDQKISDLEARLNQTLDTFLQLHKGSIIRNICDTTGVIRTQWVPGLNIGYEHTFINQFADFVEGYGSRKKRPLRPDFRDALETQYICEAVLDSAKTGRWKKVGKIKA